MAISVLGVSLLSAAFDWLAVWRNRRTFEVIFKPATLAALAAWFVLTTRLQGQSAWFAAGLVLSLTGDIFLLLPKKLFLAGLSAFLAAHLAYAAGFNPTPPPVTPAGLLAAALVGAAAFLIYRRVSAGLAARHSGRTLRRGVLAYSLAIALMALSAVLTLTRPEWDRRAAASAAAGGLLFMASDTLLAFDRFVAPVRRGKLFVHITYHLGQLGLAAGAAIQLVGR